MHGLPFIRCSDFGPIKLLHDRGADLLVYLRLLVNWLALSNAIHRPTRSAVTLSGCPLSYLLRLLKGQSTTPFMVAVYRVALSDVLTRANHNETKQSLQMYAGA
jgi:hypothetical protein